MEDLYPWIKALHVISLIAWMAGLFYLPRLFVYHCKAEPGSEMSETFKVMEGKLLKMIMNPAMIGSWMFGLILAFGFGMIDWSGDFWFHAKLLLVLALTGFHMICGRWRKDFEADRNVRPERFYRMANEFPTLMMMGIVILVIVRPF